MLKEIAHVARKKKSLISSHILCLRFKHDYLTKLRRLQIRIQFVFSGYETCELVCHTLRLLS